MREIQNTLRKSALVCALALAGTAPFNIVHAATAVTALYAFAGGNDGAAPQASVTDKKGNLYGTTTSGGGNGACNSGQGCGTVFKLASDGTESVLYSFCSKANCADGAVPAGGLLADEEGNFYGVTESGGAGSSCTVAAGCGTVFKLEPNGAETVVYSFCSKTNCSDGAGPTDGLIMDKKGNLYGATFSGGTGTGCSQGCGTVFKLTTKGREKVIYSFCPYSSCQDGQFPTGSLIRKKDVLYGTTAMGGRDGAGTVFALAADGAETVLYSFCAACSDGIYPTAGLVRDKSSNLYGTTSQGGSRGAGTVFKLASDGTEMVLYSFRGPGLWRSHAGGPAFRWDRYPDQQRQRNKPHRYA